MFQCGELLDRFSAGGQWRWWRVLLRQTGRAQLRQKNQRLVVPVVSSTRLCDATPVSRQPSAWLTHGNINIIQVRLLLLTVSVFVPVTVRAGRFSHSCAKVRCLLRSTITVRHTVDTLSPSFTCWARFSLVTFVFFCASVTLVHPVFNPLLHANFCLSCLFCLCCVLKFRITPHC